MPSHQAVWHPKQVLKRSAVGVVNMGVDDGCVQKIPRPPESVSWSSFKGGGGREL